MECPDPNIFPVYNRVLQVNRGAPFCQAVDPIVISAGAGGTGRGSYIVNGGDFLWVGASAVTSGGLPFTTRIQLQSEGGVFIDNQPIRSTLFWGGATTPGRWLPIPPKWLRDNAQVNFTLGVIGAPAASTVRLFLWGYRAACGDEKLYGPGRGLFILGSDDNGGAGSFLTANGTASPNIVMPQGFHFRSVYHHAETGSGSTDWRGSITYRDVRAPYSLPITKPGNRVNAGVFVGTAAAPFAWPSTPVIYEGSPINYDLQDFSAANQDLFICHIGAKVPLTLEDAPDCSPLGRGS